jgi:hypothetical protein
MRFLLEARAAGHELDREAAAQLMAAVCAQRACLVPLDANDFSVEVGRKPRVLLCVWAASARSPRGFSRLLARYAPL